MRQALLQRGFGVVLQLRIDGGVDRVGIGRQAGDAISLGFAAKEIDEMEAAVAVRKGGGDALGRRRQCLVLLRRSDDAVLLHALKDVSETILGAIGMAIGIVIIRTLE